MRCMLEGGTVYFGVCSFTGIVQRALRSRRGFGTGYTYFVDCISTEQLKRGKRQVLIE